MNGEFKVHKLSTGWTDADLVQAAKDDEMPKLKESDYEPSWKLIYDDDVVGFRNYFEKNWESNKKYAVLMDCSQVKPYRFSPTHMKVDSAIKKAGLNDDIQQYTCSDPLGLVPYEWETYWPAYKYEMKTAISDEAFDKMVDIFEEQFKMIKDYHKYWITFMPSAKLAMAKGGMKRADIKTVDVPYGLYEEPPFEEMVKEFENKGECDIFNKDGNWSFTGVDR